MQHTTDLAVPDCTACENDWLRIAESIVQQRAPEDILCELCAHTGRTDAERQVAFYLLGGNGWQLVTHGGLTQQSRLTLARILPDELSAAVLAARAEGSEESGFPFESGWARHVESATGELFGLFVRIDAGPRRPSALYATRIGVVCRLAALALEQKNLLAELAFKADHDALTGLFNRSYYERVLASSLKRHQGGGPCSAFLSIDLDRFRLINDVMGHAVGNSLLEKVGNRFHACVGNDGILARAGGDEFAIILPVIRSAEEATDIAERLFDSLATPFSIEGHQLFITASIGIADSGPHSTAAALEREAHIALFHAKKAGKARWMRFHASMAATPPERLEMEKRLRFALEGREMLLYYQPQIELQSGMVRGAEALLRWRADDLGIVSPSAFIPILEETGLIMEFGRWVLWEACRQGRQWAEQMGSPMRVGVNVSALQFTRSDFGQDVERALAETGLPPGSLELELTESLFIGEFETAARNLQRIRNLGVTFALDDFGTGQSCLSYLQHLSFQRLKIDQMFIRTIQEDQPLPPLVDNIIRMANTLGMTTIGEGVETRHQAEVLREAGCHEGQGYYWARPIPANEFLAFCHDYVISAG